MQIVIALLVGILIGLAISRKRPVGNLRVDHSDPNDAPYLFLELSTDVASISRKKEVVLRVRVENFIPHE